MLALGLLACACTNWLGPGAPAVRIEDAGVPLRIAAWIVALAIEVYAWAGSHGTTDALSQRDFIIVAVAGLTVAVIGTGMFVVFMLTRYFRYWLIRLIYQDRESTDRLIDKLGER